MERFKDFLLNEEKGYLGHRVGDVLTSMQDIETDMENLGSRHLTKLADEVVNQIRKIIHDRWEPRNFKYLKDLQRIGVAIKRTIEEKGELKETLPEAIKAMQDLSGKLGVKVNSVEAPEQMGGEDIAPQDFQDTGGQPGQQQPPDQSGTPPMPGQPPPGAPPMPGQPPGGQAGAPAGLNIPPPI